MPSEQQVFTEEGEDTLAEAIEVDEAALAEVPLVTALSALLFAAGRPVKIQKLAEVLKRSVAEIEEGLLQLHTSFEAMQFGIELEEISGGVQLRTSPTIAPIIHRLIKPKVRRLSRAAAETLAVIAYKQPIEKTEIESIRGVDALPTLKTLLEHKLIRIVGRLDTVGNPALYGTTEVFLERFGLNDLTELPALNEFEQIMDDPGEVDSSDELEEEFPDDEFVDEEKIA